MSKRIPLTQGKFAIVDDEDYEWLNQWKWCAHKQRNGDFYALRQLKTKSVLMHREILGLTKDDGKQTDHRDHNGLNNKISNLRICTIAQNLQNQKPQTNKTSEFKGVSWHKQRKKWMVYIQSNKKTIHLGYFNNETKAAKTYDKKATELFGEFAYTNF